MLSKFVGSILGIKKVYQKNKLAIYKCSFFYGWLLRNDGDILEGCFLHTQIIFTKKRGCYIWRPSLLFSISRILILSFFYILYRLQSMEEEEMTLFCKILSYWAGAFPLLLCFLFTERLKLIASMEYLWRWLFLLGRD